MEIPLRRFLVLSTFSLCLFSNVGFVWSLCLEDQHSSLLKLKQTLIFDPALSSKLVSWDSSIHCCSWPGVTCSGSGHVIGLDLSEESISGGLTTQAVSSIFIIFRALVWLGTVSMALGFHLGWANLLICATSISPILNFPDKSWLRFPA
ncbi:hypothetical protein SLE2022_105560 [Rubroshorea leprosula]